MTGFIRHARIFSVCMVLSALVACSPGATVPSGSGAQAGTSAPVDPVSPEVAPPVAASSWSALPSDQRSTPPVKSQSAEPSEAETQAPAQLLPQEFAGLWTSVGQGSAETIYRFRTDGSYDKVSILLQQRPSGLFSFTIRASGTAEIAGDLLTLTPVEGTQAMDDPDSPSSNFNKPLTDLTPDEVIWAFQDGRLILTDQWGTVPYTWEPDR